MLRYYKLTLLAVGKDKWDTKEDTGSPKSMHCMDYSMPKETSNSEKIRLVALAVVELQYACLNASSRRLVGRQEVSQLVENSAK